MEKHRYYYRLIESIGSLCERTDRDLPSEKLLSCIARGGGFAFNEKNVQPALYRNGSFSDGLLFALSEYLKLPPKEFVDFTLDRPLFQDAKLGDFLKLGMRPLVEKLTGSHRLREEAFFRSLRDVDRATEINLIEVGLHLWKAEREPTTDELIETTLSSMNLGPKNTYNQLFQSYWQFNPMNFVYVVTSAHNRVGASSVVPVSDEAYEAILNGELSAFDLTVSDLRVKSNNQLILIGTLRKDGRNNTPLPEQTRSLATTIFLQIALLAQNNLENLRVLSFAGTADNDKRLKENGFRDVGKFEPRTKTTLYEMKKGLPSFTWAAKLLDSIQAANR